MSAHSRRRFACLSSILALAACSSPVVEPAASADATAGERRGPPARPWRLSGTVATMPAPPPAGCLVYFTSVIEGTATHMGRLSGVGNTCVISQVAPDPDPPFLPAGPPPYATAQFTNPLWTLTAANGDVLWIEAPEAVAVISLSDMSFRGEGRQRILGGTGRFAGATGETVIRGVNEDGQGPDDVQVTGWIRFDASMLARR